MTSKPEVVAVAFPAEAFEGAEGVGLNDYTSRVGVTCPTELIRLTDHERLQAETERLQADHEAARAADKARIAELTEVLKNAREMVADWGAYASEYFREKHGLDRDIAELDAVIAQQGKESET